MRNRSIGNMLAATLLAGLTLPSVATAQEGGQDFMSVKRMSMELAGDIAQAAVKACREKGYQVTAAVVDRNGDTQVTMRDVYAPEVSLRIARQKAYTAVMFSVSTGELENSRPEAGATLNHVDDLLFARGGLIIETGGGSMVGAVGVSGAPGGDIDESCAQKGLDAVSERLQFGGM